MKIRLGIFATVFGAALLASSAANASLVYVGSWEVDNGPNWATVPTAYSGQEAAAFLFGGTPSEYSISTVDSNPADVNFSNWISTWGGGTYCTGFPCGAVVAQNYVVTEDGLYQNPGDTSAYVDDWAVGPEYTNFAFTGTAAVPEPSSLPMLLAGLGLIGGAFYFGRKKVLARI